MSGPSPPYEGHSKLDVEDADYSKLSTVASSDSESGPPPAYSDVIASGSASATTFGATIQLQIEATGIGQCSYGPFIPRAVPIPVFRVAANTPQFAIASAEPEYISLRPKHNSNSCALVRGSDADCKPLIATIYRWGPGRHPRMRLFPPGSDISVEDAIDSDNSGCDEVDVRSRNIFSRAQRIVTSFGTFEWRYGSRTERKEAFDANSLLILDKIEKENNKVFRIAQFVRNEEFRTSGTSRYSAGNGGRLMLDLRSWADEKDAKAKEVEAFVVASCICMLKREVDRMRNNQVAAIT